VYLFPSPSPVIGDLVENTTYSLSCTVRGRAYEDSEKGSERSRGVKEVQRRSNSLIKTAGAESFKFCSWRGGRRWRDGWLYEVRAVSVPPKKFKFSRGI
jgi:hypothetical protein